MTTAQEKFETAHEKSKDLPPVAPHLVCAGAASAIEFYEKAFGAIEIMRPPGEDGKLMHGAVKIGPATIMLVDEMPECEGARPRDASLPHDEEIRHRKARSCL